MLVLLFLTSTSPVLGSESPWSYTCHTERGVCDKILGEEGVSGMSQAVCSLTCPPSTVLWPLPTSYTLDTTTTIFNPAMVTLESNTGEDNIHTTRLQQAVQRQVDMLTARGGEISGSTPGGISINVDLHGDDIVPWVGMDESYTLSINSSDNVVVTITAETYFGARHAIETLFQLTEWDSYNTAYVVLDNVSIQDEPFYPHRGISLDTARNFFPVSKIKEVIDSLSYSKMNVFHWHITDTQSFPLSLTSLPDFVKYGAYSSEMVYTRADVEDLVSYATERGVVVIPELDAPAHVGAGWEAVDESLTVCRNKEPWHHWCVQPPCGQLNPAIPAMYDVLQTIHREILDMFNPVKNMNTRATYHMGGDEVHFGCWNSSDSIVEWLNNEGKERNEEGFMYLWNYFQTESLKRVENSSLDMGMPSPSIMLWSSHLTHPEHIHYLDPEKYTIQIWTDSTDCDEPTIKAVAEAGLKMVFSNVDGAYLDCGFAGWVTDGNNWCSPYKGWQAIYENDPHKIIERHNVVNEEEAKMNILGGEVAMWSEQTDEMSLMTKVEPRAAAYGERLWRGPSAGGWREAESRMVRHRERLRVRGVGADALVQRWCNQNQGKCLLPPSGNTDTPSCQETTSTVDTQETTSTGDNSSAKNVIFFYLLLIFTCMILGL